jgi:hypothetical protein
MVLDHIQLHFQMARRQQFGVYVCHSFIQIFSQMHQILQWSCIMWSQSLHVHGSNQQELQELNSSIEEAKADIVGLWALRYLLDKVKKRPYECRIHFLSMQSNFNLIFVIILFYLMPAFAAKEIRGVYVRFISGWVFSFYTLRPPWSSRVILIPRTYQRLTIDGNS